MSQGKEKNTKQKIKAAQSYYALKVTKSVKIDAK